MKLIVGLGNPGDRYKNTRHNVGFMVLDSMAKKSNVAFQPEQKFQSEIGELEKNKLIKPQTFMNESGQAVRAIKDFYKIDNSEVWVIHDDVDLELGKVRIQNGGTSAGHKGIQSIIDHLGEEFWRIRVGVGKSEKVPTEEWVLMNFEEGETEHLAEIIDQTANLVLECIEKEIKEETLNF
jgi:peptidyl-tRNA hydrolase, PTH1 family